MPTLTNEQLEHLDTFGFLAVDHVFDPDEVIAPVIDEYGAVLDQLCDELVESGDLAEPYAELPFGERVSRVYAETQKVYAQYFDFSLPQKNIQRDTPYWAGPAVFAALTNPQLLDVVEQIVGPEIYSNPVQHVRVKVPESIAPRDADGNVIYGATPWHQDSGVVNAEADDTDMLTVWFPLMDTDAENGCLQVLPGSHRGEVLTHCSGVQGLAIPGAMLAEEQSRAVPLPAGGVLFLHRKTVHAALPNVSDRIRWSFDLRYQPVGQPTGRASFPGFVARSRSRPETALRDPYAWNEMWREARNQLADQPDPNYNRWDADDPACA